MPFKIRKMPNQPCYEVYKPKTGRKYAKCTTMKKARKQIALLNAIEHTPGFVPGNQMKGGKRRSTEKRKRKTEKYRCKTY